MENFSYQGEDTLPEGWENATDAQREHYWLTRAQYQAKKIMDDLNRPIRQREASQQRVETMLDAPWENDPLLCSHKETELVYCPPVEWGDTALDGGVEERCVACKKLMKVAA